MHLLSQRRLIEHTDTSSRYIIRSGEFIAAGTGKLYHLQGALLGEADGCVAAMGATANLGIFRAIFESGSTTLVTAIKKGGYDLADTGVLMREAQSLSFLHFDHADFVYYSRHCNKVSHSLATKTVLPHPAGWALLLTL